jgi:hypothetical protein
VEWCRELVPGPAGRGLGPAENTCQIVDHVRAPTQPGSMCWDVEQGPQMMCVISMCVRYSLSV